MLAAWLLLGKFEHAPTGQARPTFKPFERVAESRERLLTVADLVVEHAAAASAAEQTHRGELASRLLQPTRCLRAFLLERAPPFGEPAVLLREPGTVRKDGRVGSRHRCDNGERLG